MTRKKHIFAPRFNEIGCVAQLDRVPDYESGGSFSFLRLSQLLNQFNTGLYITFQQGKFLIGDNLFCN